MFWKRYAPHCNWKMKQSVEYPNKNSSNVLALCWKCQNHNKFWKVSNQFVKKKVFDSGVDRIWPLVCAAMKGHESFALHIYLYSSVLYIYLYSSVYGATKFFPFLYVQLFDRQWTRLVSSVSLCIRLLSVSPNPVFFPKNYFVTHCDDFINRIANWDVVPFELLKCGEGWKKCRIRQSVLLNRQRYS